MGKIRCRNCGQILESKHLHDFVMCECENKTFVDGGNDYLRYGGINVNLIEILEDPGENINEGRLPNP
jgi:hypothetical protein